MPFLERIGDQDKVPHVLAAFRDEFDIR